MKYCSRNWTIIMVITKAYKFCLSQIATHISCKYVSCHIENATVRRVWIEAKFTFSSFLLHGALIILEL